MRRPAPLPVDLLGLARAQEGLLSAAQCDRAGVTAARRRALRGTGGLQPVLRGVDDVAPLLVDAPFLPLVPDPGHRRRRAAWLALLAAGVDRAVAVGACALALYGVEGLPGVIRPEAALPGASPRARRGGVVVRCFDPGVTVRSRGHARLVEPVRALAQAVCELDRDHAVAVLDSAVHRRLVRDDELAVVAALVRGRRGASAVSGWWDLLDGRAQSPLETWARLQCRDEGVAPHDLQVPVRDGLGRVVAHGDLGWWLRDGRLLVAEIDGAGPHGTPDALYRDRERQNRVVGTGALLLRFTADDVRSRRVASEVRRHLLG